MAQPARKIAMNPPDVAPPIRPYYSNCVKVAAGSLLFISGQVGMDKSGKIAAGAKAQTALALENIQAILRSNGATLDDLLKVTVFVTDMRHFDEIAEVRNRYFPANGPASTIVEVSKLALPGLLIEIESVAAVP